MVVQFNKLPKLRILLTSRSMSSTNGKHKNVSMCKDACFSDIYDFQKLFYAEVSDMFSVFKAAQDEMTILNSLETVVKLSLSIS